MDDLRELIEAEKESIDITLTLLSEILSKSEKTIHDLTVLGAYLHNFYNGIENILKRVLIHFGYKIPKSDMWHQELIQMMIKNDFISTDIGQELKKYLGFRHYFVHGYSFMLEEAPLLRLSINAQSVWEKFYREIQTNAL